MAEHNEKAPQEDTPATSLPTDLYLPILDNIEDRSVLAKLCLIDRLFLDLAREKLYDFVWVRPCESRSALLASARLHIEKLYPILTGESGADRKVHTFSKSCMEL
jgi:hypothetical protein